MATDFYKDKNIAVFGLGVSGRGVAEFLCANGAKNVVVWDNSETAIKNSNFKPCDLNSADLTQFDFIVVSPGIANHHPICQTAIKNNIPLIGEVELLWQTNPNATYIGITGTNGKSTTTGLIAHILTNAGINHQVGGNFGTPAVALNKLSTGEVYVLEMSSYMLTRVPNMKFNIGVFLNISPDHLAWHQTMENYYQAKAKIFANMTSDDVAIICNDDKYGARLANATTTPNKIIVSKNDIDKTYKYLCGDHNNQNIACSIAVCQALGVAPDIIETAINSFRGLAHRQQFIAKIGATTFINDSKATNAVSAQKALATYQNIYWICGGEEKDCDYSVLAKPLQSNVVQAYIIGKKTPQHLLSYLKNNAIPYTVSTDLNHAFNVAYQDAKKSPAPHNVVLLSPACASFDQFKNFEARGHCFIELVKGVTNG